MKKAMVLFLLAGSLPAIGKTATFTGVITDSMCGRDHKMMNITPDAKCVRECVNSSSGAKFALVNGSNVYKLSDQSTPARFAGQKVQVTGTLFPRTGIIEVKDIRPAK